MISLLSSLGSLLGSLIKSLFFKSAEEKLGAVEERNKTLERQVRVSEAMRKAPKVSSDEELSDVLKKGRFAILFLALFLSGCGNSPVIGCPSIAEYTETTQERADTDLKLLPKDSPIRTMLKDCHNLRNEARACSP